MTQVVTRKATHAHLEFYKKFKREADEYDNDFIKKYDDEANTTLVFAGLFSAVASAFIIDVESQLQPDYTQMSYELLRIIASSSLGNISTGPGAALPQWTGPDPAIVQVQAILYASLAASLLAAFIAMLGRQWLNRFAQVEMSGSISDRSRNRVRKLDGMVTWHFDLVMECLPLMLQIALLLLGYALSHYLVSLNKVVAGVVIGFTTFSLLFYLFIVFAATFSYNCPFQTPLSLIIRFMIRFDDNHRKYLRRCRQWFGCLISLSWSKKRPLAPHPRGDFDAVNPDIIDNPVELAMAGPLHQPPPSFDKAVWDGYVLDSDSIIRLYGISTDADVVLAITNFIPEIVWHAGIQTTPLESLYDTVLECFDRSSGQPVVIPGLRNEAYLSAKTFLHITIQRKCIGNESDNVVLKSISSRHLILGSKNYKGDSDLESTLRIIDHVLGHSNDIHWDASSFSVPHHAWMGHILLYRAWDVLRESITLPDDIKQFVLHSLRLEPLPPAPIVTDCLFIIGLVLGIKFDVHQLLVINKSREQNQKIGRIYGKLIETMQNTNATIEEINRTLKAMELIAPLSEDGIATASYNLFHVAMQTPLTDTYTQEKKWQAARFTMNAAYKGNKSLPPVEDPRDILAFLDHHFELATKDGEEQDEPIQDALRALAYASNAVTIEALKCFDPTKPSFVRGICYVYQDSKPIQLRKAALLFLPLIGDRWFDTPRPIMEPDQMESFCVDWASAIDGIEHTHNVQNAALAVMFAMMNSPHWRSHIVSENWKLLEYFTSVSDDSQPLKRCLDNIGLIDAVSEVGNPAAMVNWLAVLWLNYKQLITEVRKQLERRTKEIGQGEGKANLDGYLSVMNSELKKAEGALKRYSELSTDPDAVHLRTKVDNLQQARASLIVLKG